MLLNWVSYVKSLEFKRETKRGDTLYKDLNLIRVSGQTKAEMAIINQFCKANTINHYPLQKPQLAQRQPPVSKNRKLSLKRLQILKVK
jgi:hypothetical protein